MNKHADLISVACEHNFSYLGHNNLKPKRTERFGVCTLYIGAAVGPLLSDPPGLGVKGAVHLVSTQHITGGDGHLRQVAVGGVGAAH